MKQAKQSMVLAAFVVLAAGAGTAAAQVEPVPEEDEGDGYALTLGGGVSQFLDSELDELAGTAGFWELRGYVGTKRPVGLELAYLGQANDLEPRLGTADSAMLIGTGAEAVLRANIVTVRSFQPYVVAGVGWKRYDVTNSDFSTSAEGVSDADNVVEIPVGAGLAYRFRGLFADARFTVRGAMNEDLVIGTPDHPAENDFMSDDDNFLAMHNWQAGARVGYEF